MNTVTRLVTLSSLAMAALIFASAATAPSAQAVSNPVIRAVSPTSGGPGSEVTIEGDGFVVGATVLFGSVPSTGVVVFPSSMISAKAPAGLGGPVAITVINPDGGRASVPDAFVYGRDSDYLTVKSVSPTTGPSSGGVTVTLTGTGFAADASVSFGGIHATNLLALGSSLTVRVPPHPAGIVDVTVTNPDGRVATLVGGFSYSGSGSSTSLLPAQGFALFVFGGTSSDLVAASGCAFSRVAFWAIDESGAFVPYVPGSSVTIVNAPWSARFAAGIPAGTVLIGRCG